MSAEDDAKEAMYDDSDDGIEAQYRAMMRKETNASRDTSKKLELKRLYEEEVEAIENTLRDFLE